MSTELFTEPTPLQREAHSGMRFKKLANFAHANKLYASVIAGSEFFSALQYYPVMFVKNAKENLVSIALMSLNKNGHNYGDEMRGVYVPAYIRRYPFIMDSSSNVLYFDKSCDSLQYDDGEALFNDAGEVSEFLNEILVFNKQLDTAYKSTTEYVAALEEKGLLEPYQGKLNFQDQIIKLDNYLVVNDNKFHEMLAGDELESWFKKGWVAWTYAHLASLGAMQRVVDRLALPQVNSSEANEA